MLGFLLAWNCIGILIIVYSVLIQLSLYSKLSNTNYKTEHRWLWGYTGEVSLTHSTTSWFINQLLTGSMRFQICSFQIKIEWASDWWLVSKCWLKYKFRSQTFQFFFSKWMTLDLSKLVPGIYCKGYSNQHMANWAFLFLLLCDCLDKTTIKTELTFYTLLH